MQQGNFIDVFLTRHVSGTYAHHQEHQIFSCGIWFSAPSFWMGDGVYGFDGAVRHHPHRSHDLRSVSQDNHPFTNSVQKTICRNSTSNVPDDGCMYPKHVQLRIHQQNYLVASSWHFNLFLTSQLGPSHVSPDICELSSYDVQKCSFILDMCERGSKDSSNTIRRYLASPSLFPVLPTQYKQNRKIIIYRPPRTSK